ASLVDWSVSAPKTSSTFPGSLLSSSTSLRDSASVMVPRTWARWRARTKRAVSWAVKALVEATPISGPALVVRVPWALRVMAAPTTLQMARVLDPLAMSSAWAARVSAVSPDWVMRGPMGGGSGWGAREAGEALDHELAGESSVPGGSAGGDGDLGGVAEVVVGDLHGLEEDVAGVEGDAAEGGVADGSGLLVNFFEH